LIDKEEPMTGLKIGRSILIILLVAAAGCEVVDEGAWVKINRPEPSVQIGTTTTVDPIPSPVDTEYTERLRYVTCELPPGVSVDVDPTVAPFYVGERSSVCIGEPGGQEGSRLCWGVHAFEEYARAVADCYVQAKQELAQQGSRVLPGTWWDLAAPMMPPGWSRSEREALQLATRTSMSIAEMMGGGEVSADPLCFPRAQGTSAEAAKDHAMTQLSSVVSVNSQEIAAMLSTLKRGVHLKVNADLTLKLGVVLVVKPSLIVDAKTLNACTFNSLSR
jgi:hypothetical protein